MLIKAREQFLTVWQRQNRTQRFIMGGLVLGALIAAFVFISWSSSPSYGVAFTNMSEADAGKVIERLDELAIPYRLRGSGTILVPSDQVYEVRLKMAREGLPEGSSTGFELFSGNTLGMTEFTQRVNYQRALEGELERTIGSMAAVEAVKVHVVFPEKSLLQQDQVLTTSSVTIQEKIGANLDAAQVRAITHLVASSVEGLKPENVVVVDINGNMLASGSMSGETAEVAFSNEHRAIEAAAASDLQKKVQELLDSALGPGRGVVKASVTMDWTQRETTQQAYDPTSATLRSSQWITETIISSGDGIGGIPGAATNLPPVTGVITNGAQLSQYEHYEKTHNFEITQTESKEILAPGRVERVSLSVLVDNVEDPEQLATLRSSVAAAAGIDEQRGDLLEVKTVAFDRTSQEALVEELNADQQTELYWQIGEIALAVLILLGLLWYVQRLLTRLRLASSQEWIPVIKTVEEMMLPKPGVEALATGGEGLVAATTPSPEKEVQLEKEIEALEPAFSAVDEQMQRMVIRLAEEKPSTVAEIIQMWLSEDEG